MNWAVVMAGGRGTRFWPESRAKRPKPFLRLLGNRTLLEETVDRIRPLFKPSQIFLVIQDELVSEARRLLPRIPRENILGEPMGRNTAPCAVYAASQIGERDPSAKMVFLPADQHIQGESLFRKTIKVALEMADDWPVLIGIPPTTATPAYGYLEVGRTKKKREGLPSFPVIRFHEKPTVKRAREYLRRGNFFWNGGIFAWRLDAFKQAIRKYLPRLYPAFSKLAPFPGGTLLKKELASVYEWLPSISLDYGVLEKMKHAHCLLAPFQLSDLGGWVSLAEFWPSDRAKNRTQGKVLLVKSRGNIVKGNKRLIALLSVQDLVVIDTPDALLICPRSETEKIRDVVRELERRKAKEYL